jgi:hypothetical protein
VDRPRVCPPRCEAFQRGHERPLGERPFPVGACGTIDAELREIPAKNGLAWRQRKGAVVGEGGLLEEQLGALRNGIEVKTSYFLRKKCIERSQVGLYAAGALDLVEV